MAEAAFQFHCMICYEEFDNSALRHPVVLPCGHTYVCKSCGDRLDKCMECREPLFIKVAPTADGPHTPLPALASTASRTTASWSSSRRAPAASNQHVSPKKVTPPTTIKKRLPLPKNAVLLSLIEATRMISADTQIHAEGEATHDIAIGASTSRDSSLMDEYHEEDPIHVELAAKVSAGTAGTYAVSAREGLKIFPNRPGSSGVALSRSRISFTDEDVSSLVDFFHEQKMDSHQGDDKAKEALATLAYGDRIQVVSIDDGWAKLARGYGYVHASSSAIVKVGNPMDRSCILEAMLRTLSDRRKELRQKQSENDTQFVKLMNKLQTSLQGDEDLTVVCKTAFKEEPHEDDLPENVSTEESILETIPMGRVGSSIQHNGSWCCDPMVETTLAPIEQNVPHSYDTGHKSSVLGSSTPSPSRMRAGAAAWRERQGREVRNSIDFRTGMSGHKAAMSSKTHSHPHDYLNTPERSARATPNVTPPPRKTGLLKMSTHSGLTFKKSSRKPNGGFGPLSWTGSD